MWCPHEWQVLIGILGSSCYEKAWNTRPNHAHGSHVADLAIRYLSLRFTYPDGYVFWYTSIILYIYNTRVLYTVYIYIYNYTYKYFEWIGVFAYPQTTKVHEFIPTRTFTWCFTGSQRSWLIVWTLQSHAEWDTLPETNIAPENGWLEDYD